MIKTWIKWIVLLTLSLSIFTSCSTPKVVYRDVDPAKQVVLQRDTLERLMEECVEQKILLLNCLERERK